MKLKVQTSDYLRFVQRARRVVYEKAQQVVVTDGIITAHASSEIKARSLYHTYIHTLPVSDLKAKGYMV